MMLKDKNGCQTYPDIYCWKCTCAYDNKVGHEVNGSTNEPSLHKKLLGVMVGDDGSQKGYPMYRCITCDYHGAYNSDYYNEWKIK